MRIQTGAQGSRGGDETQESIGPPRDAILPTWIRTANEQKPLRVRPASAEAGENTVRGSPGDEPGRARAQGKALKGGNPMSGSGVKQSRRAREDQTHGGLRKTGVGRRSDGNPSLAALTRWPIRWSSYAEGVENLKGGAVTQPRRLRPSASSAAAPAGVSEEGPKPERGRTIFSGRWRETRVGRPQGRPQGNAEEGPGNQIAGTMRAVRL